MQFKPDDLNISLDGQVLKASSSEADKGFAFGGVIFTSILFGLYLREYDFFLFIFLVCIATLTVHFWFKNETWTFMPSHIYCSRNKIGFFKHKEVYEIVDISKSYVTEYQGDSVSYIVNIVHKNTPTETVSSSSKNNANYISNHINESL